MIPKCLIVVIILLVFSFPNYAQTINATLKDSSLSEQKDIIDVIQKNLHINFRKDSFSGKGRGPYISVIPVVGYSLQSGLTGAIVSNTSFFTDNSRNRFSNLLLNAYYSEYHQFWLTANSRIFFEKYKLHLFGDIRYYNFPTQTYGIGVHSSLSDKLNINYSYVRICQIIYHEIFRNIFAGLGYNLDYHWNITTDGNQGKAMNDFITYQQGRKSVSSGVSFNFLFDNRRNSVNPDGGYFVNFQYRPNLRLLGSDTEWQSLLTDLRTYIKLPHSSRNILAFWNYNNFTIQGTPPYLDWPRVGWDAYSNTGRGYVPGRYVGKNFNYLESEYRFAITSNGLVGGVLFGNAETVFQKWTEKYSIIPGGGVGIRIKMNKNSNTNLAVDYGFGVGGSHGLFFNLGEIF